MTRRASLLIAGRPAGAGQPAQVPQPASVPHAPRVPQRAPVPQPARLPRLLPADGRAAGLVAHLAQHGALPYRGGPGRLIADVMKAGLTGRGGAAFPAGRKLAAVAAAGRRPVVVANAAESEPLSAKDKTLLRYSPHLVLDGLQLAAEAVGARRAVLYLHEDLSLRGELSDLLAERRSGGLDRVGVDLVVAPPRFLSGQETAVVNVINGGAALPTFTPPRTFERGVGGQPTLVQNVETLAHLALIARYGAGWFRGLGTADEPGSMLCSVRQADGSAGVVEAALGTPLRDLIRCSRSGAGRSGRRLPRGVAARPPGGAAFAEQRRAGTGRCLGSARVSWPRSRPDAAGWPRRPGWRVISRSSPLASAVRA